MVRHNGDLLYNLSFVSGAKNKFEACKYFYASIFTTMATN